MKNPNWQKYLICGDSKDVIKHIPDNSIDFIFTDPPYNIGKHSTGNIILPGRSAMNNDVATWDWIDFNPEEWADEFIRILKPTGNLFIFTSYNQIGRWYDSLDAKFDTSNYIVWHKTNPAPKIFKAGFLNSCEMIFTCWNKKHTWNFISQAEMHNFLESPICMYPERLNNPKHPAQKPVSILKKLIKIASNQDDIIFDPFMGVGSIGVAALQMNRKFIGVELDKTYFEASKRRIDKMIDIKNNEETVLSEPIIAYSPDTVVDQRKRNKKRSIKKENGIYFDIKDIFEVRILQPIIKWAGGKEKELKYILPNLPEFENYYEPFVGGGSVFAAISAKHFYINDLSEELISLYRNIAANNERFYEYVYSIEDAWKKSHDFFINNQNLKELYLNYRNELISKVELKNSINDFCNDKKNEISNILPECFSNYPNIMAAELNKNLFRKMQRMNILEKQKHILPDKDLNNNIETAIRSALYMNFRNLYNDNSIKLNNDVFHCALFLFIRNYCYSGMFRYNANGDFNVPYGGIGYNGKSMAKKITYYKSDAIIKKLSQTDICNSDFENFLQKYNPSKNDFVFLDPPYDSEFSSYAQNEFNKDDQKRLADYMINKCKAKWMLIIKNTEFIYNLYNRKGINIHSFDKKYIVSFMNRNDRQVTHLLITNY